MKLNILREAMYDLIESGDFDIFWPVDIRKSNMVGIMGLHEVEYDDNDKPYHVIRIANAYAKEAEVVGTVIHELLHCEQAEQGLHTDHDEAFMTRVEHLRKKYPFEIA